MLLMCNPEEASSSSRELDPLLRDLSEKKQSFRNNVLSLATELKNVRSRLALQEESFIQETLTRQVAETKARSMEEEIMRLQKSLEERNVEMQNSASAAEQYLKDMNDLKSQLSATRATADASVISAQSAQLQCLALSKELDEKKELLKDYEYRVYRLGEQVKDLQAREASQNQVKDEVVRMEQGIMQAVTKLAGANKDNELRKLLEEVSPKNIEKLNKQLIAKDEDLARLRDELRVMSAHCELKIKELQSQHLEIHQELQKKIRKLEFCRQEARAQIRQLQRMLEMKDKALEELRSQLATKQQGFGGFDKQNFWDSSGFKFIASLSMVVLVVFTKR